MSEQTPEATATEASTEQPATEATEPKPSETVDFWKQKAREQEKRAKANAEAASKLAEIEEAQKSEADKAAERLAQAEKAAADAEAKVIRRELAIEHKLSKEDAALLDAITDEDTLRTLAERLAPSEEVPGSRPPRPDANQGRSGAGGPTSTADSFAEFFRHNI